MPTVSPTTGTTGVLSVPASSSVDVMRDTAFENSGPMGNKYAIAATTQAAGIVLDVFFGSVQVADGLGLRVAGAVGDVKVPDDLKVNQRAAANQKIRVLARNTTAGALTCNVIVDIT